MKMERLILIAVIGSVTAILMRTVRQEYAVLIGIATAVLLLLGTLLRLTGIAETLHRICAEYRIAPAMIGSILKILGIAYLTEFGVNVSKDAGQQAIAGGISIGGRVLILSCALPAVVTMLETGISLIREASP